MVQSGDQITVRSQPRGGPPKEKIILFSNLTSGKPARRAGPSLSGLHIFQLLVLGLYWTKIDHLPIIIKLIIYTF